MNYKNEPIYKQTIYVILCTDDDDVYIGKAKNEQLKEAFRRHRYGRYSLTKTSFEDAMITGMRPRMYRLQEVETTEREAYRYVLAWARKFDDYGYYLLCTDHFYHQVMELNDGSECVYDSISYLSPMDMIDDENELFADYGMRRKRNNGENPAVVTVSVTGEEYDYISSKAEELDISMSQFAKQLIMRGYVQRVDIDVFRELVQFNETLRKHNEVLKQILASIYNTGKYYPMDLKIIQEQTDEIKKERIKVMENINRVLRELRKDVREHIES